MKKIMCLGGNYYQMTAIKAAKRMGCHVISVDYCPDNPAHKYADEYYNISTVYKKGILERAKELKIDAIISYASDVSAPTAAYVAESMGLPTNPLESVQVMTRKDSFRSFLTTHDFLVPSGQAFSDIKEAKQFFSRLKKPAMIKPVDASGSKGVSKLYQPDGFDDAFKLALSYSMSKLVIVEEFIQRDGYQIAGDGFVVNGELVFAGFMNEHFDRLCNPLVPIGESYPSIMTDLLKKKARKEIQKCLSLLNFKFGAVNLDFIVDKTGEICILELAPRNGGNLITDAIYAASGVDLAEYTVRAALGLDCSDLIEKEIQTYVSSYILHSAKKGKFNHINVNPELEADIIKKEIFIKKGQEIQRFDNGSFGIGAMLIKHDSIEQMCYRMDHMEEFLQVCLD